MIKRDKSIKTIICFIFIFSVQGLTASFVLLPCSSSRQQCTASQTKLSATKKGQCRNVLRWYDSQLRRAPLRTKMISSGMVSVIGDSAAQMLTSGGSIFDLRRSVSWALCGAFYFAPFLHLWYAMLAALENRARKRYGVPKTATITLQLLANQSIGAGIINALFFYIFEFASALVGLLLLDPILLHPNQLIATATRNLQAKFSTIMFANWCIWPLPSLLNLVYIPLQYRVLFTNCVALLWKCVLSMLTAGHISSPR
mmetsp:Transcript_13686/g.18244  ORF Transcript_13686/g.18244 Transcript_13686/m.18244 type:complete len:256 (-) Transcript_13686:434-1201(-)